MVTTSTTDSENERLEIVKDTESENESGKLNKMAASQVRPSSIPSGIDQNSTCTLYVVGPCWYYFKYLDSASIVFIKTYKFIRFYKSGPGTEGFSSL